MAQQKKWLAFEGFAARHLALKTAFEEFVALHQLLTTVFEEFEAWFAAMNQLTLVIEKGGLSEGRFLMSEENAEE